MRLLFIADARSPIARQWISYFIRRGDEVYLASTFPASPPPGIKGFQFIPVGFSQLARGNTRTLAPRPSWGTHLRHWLAPLTLPRAAHQLRRWAAVVRPALVHALRIPYEGMLTAAAKLPFPWLISVWGNDFTLHAPASPLLSFWTRYTLKNTHGLHADCQRDVRLAHRWGLPATRPTLVIPGNGGVDRSLFFPPPEPVSEPVVINPRGLRAYVRNDLFFRAVREVLSHLPNARFICLGMAGHPLAEAWIDELHLRHAVTLLPTLPHAEMASLYRRAAVLISPSEHDGTPNSVLEGMACGCLPVAGDLESLREWIRPGENGLLFPPSDVLAQAQALLRALSELPLRRRAWEENPRLIAERADYASGMAQAARFYQQIAF